ncbi:MAG: response regulator [Pyrinomonadaceae bacterium]
MERFVLIADDDPALSRLVQTLVESEGFIAATVKDGKEAYAALRSGADFVAAIVDIQMPYIDGHDLVKFMRSDERFANIPVLIMTGDRDPRTTAKALSSGAVGFLPKPFTNAQLKTALKTLISASNKR